MKSLYIVVLLVIIADNCLAQTYISLAPQLTNSPGTLYEKRISLWKLGDSGMSLVWGWIWEKQVWVK